MTSYLIILYAILYLCTLFADGLASPCRRISSRKWVYCQEKQLIEVPSSIIKDTKKLILHGNMIKNSAKLDNKLLQLTNLVEVNMNYNLLDNVPCLPVSLLKAEFGHNNIKSVNFSRLKKLQTLNLEANSLTTSSFNSKTFKDTQSLREIIIDENKLISIPPYLPSTLRVLSIKQNKIQEINVKDFQHLVKLEVLELENNNLKNNFIKLGSFSYLKNLKKLNLKRNNLINIPPKLPGHLKSLQIAYNKIEVLYKSESVEHGGMETLKTVQVRYM